MNRLLRQQLKDLARKTLPDLPWVDNTQGANAMVGLLKLSIFAGGYEDSFVWIDLKYLGKSSLIYPHELQRGYNIRNDHEGEGPFDYLEKRLQEVHQMALNVQWKNEMPVIPLARAVPVAHKQFAAGNLSFICYAKTKPGESRIEDSGVILPTETEMLRVDLNRILGFAYALRWASRSLRAAPGGFPMEEYDRLEAILEDLVTIWRYQSPDKNAKLKLALVCKDIVGHLPGFELIEG